MTVMQAPGMATQRVQGSSVVMLRADSRVAGRQEAQHSTAPAQAQARSSTATDGCDRLSPRRLAWHAGALHAALLMVVKCLCPLQQAARSVRCPKATGGALATSASDDDGDGRVRDCDALYQSRSPRTMQWKEFATSKQRCRCSECRGNAVAQRPMSYLCAGPAESAAPVGGRWSVVGAGC
jgi:hypothetical protein